MNIYLLIIFGYVLPAIVFIGANMLLEKRLIRRDIVFALTPIINLVFSVVGVCLAVVELDIFNKVIWSKKK